MAITINIYYTGLNGGAKKFAEEMLANGVVDEIRAKDGNLQYEYFFPMESPETVLLIDIPASPFDGNEEDTGFTRKI